MKDHDFRKLVVFVCSAVPAALLLWDAYRNQLGANPIDFALGTTGMMALIFLILSLSVTPLRLITGANWLSLFRKMLGLYAFFYGSVHLLIYFIFDRSLSLKSVITDVTQRWFILVGMTALLLMVPLALTSTNGAIKRMGAANWKRLHRLAYIAGIAGVAHYYLLVKADVRQPVMFAVALAILLLYRPLASRYSFLRRPRKVASPA